MKLPGYSAESSFRTVLPQSGRAIPIPFPPCTRNLLECFAGDQGGCNAFFANNCYSPDGPAPGGPLCSAAYGACVAGSNDACSYWNNCHASGPLGGGNGGGGSSGGFHQGVAHE